MNFFRATVSNDGKNGGVRGGHYDKGEVYSVHSIASVSNQRKKNKSRKERNLEKRGVSAQNHEKMIFGQFVQK
jgi:hypothetical protein